MSILAPNRLSNITRIFMTLICLGLLGLFVHLGWVCYISDSEIWPVTLAAHLDSEWNKHWVLSRPVFYAILGLFERFPSSSSDTLMAARLASILNGVGIALLTALVTRRFTSNALAVWLAPILLLSNSGFLNQGFRIRSDLYSTTFLLLFLWMALRGKNRRTPAFATFILPLLATPKAILSMISLASFLPIRFEKVANALRSKLIAITTVSIVILGAILLWKSHLLARLYGGSLEYFTHAFSATDGGVRYFSGISWIYVTRILERNWLFVPLLLARFLTLEIRLKFDAFESAASKAIHLKLLAAVVLMSIWIVFYPDRLPFFIASLLPFFCIFSALLLDDLQALSEKVQVLRRNASKVGLSIALLGIVSLLWIRAMYFYLENVELNSNRPQLAAVEILEKYTAQYPKATFYDVIGVLPKKTKILLFAGPGEPVWNKYAYRFLEEHPPDLLFRVAKFSYLDPEISIFIAANYIGLGQGVFARAERLKQPIKLDLTRTKTTAQTIQRVSKDLGLSALTPITLEIGLDALHNEIIITSLESLPGDLKKRGVKNAQIIRISRFIPPQEPLSAPLSTLFRFDTDF